MQISVMMMHYTLRRGLSEWMHRNNRTGVLGLRHRFIESACSLWCGDGVTRSLNNNPVQYFHLFCRVKSAGIRQWRTSIGTKSLMTFFSFCDFQSKIFETISKICRTDRITLNWNWVVGHYSKVIFLYHTNRSGSIYKVETLAKRSVRSMAHNSINQWFSLRVGAPTASRGQKYRGIDLASGCMLRVVFIILLFSGEPLAQR